MQPLPAMPNNGAQQKLFFFLNIYFNLLELLIFCTLFSFVYGVNFGIFRFFKKVAHFVDLFYLLRRTASFVSIAWGPSGPPKTLNIFHLMSHHRRDQNQIFPYSAETHCCKATVILSGPFSVI